MYEFKYREKVSFDNGVIKGTGLVLGVANAEQPVLGYGYAVKVLESDLTLPNEEYPFEVIIVSSIHMHKASDGYTYHEDGSQAAEDEIFVFGSNLSGIHGAGAARAAFDYYGAVWGQPIGHFGQSYAVPTKNASIDFTLQPIVIQGFVDALIKYATKNPDLKFFITRIGCGLAGMKDEEVAPMFKGAPASFNFPANWKQFLE